MTIPIINVSTLNGNNGFRLDGEPLFAHFSGESVSSAGDINGDGFDDVMIGAPYEYRHYLLDGLSYVIFGKASGFSAATNLYSLDGNIGFRLSDSSAGSPYLVSDVGDINGDGFDDVIIGAQGGDDFYPPYTRDPGAAYVVFGKASGFDAHFNLSNLDGSNGYRVDVGGSLSVAVSGAGDVNGDGFDDVIVGAGGAANVVFGKASGFDPLLNLSNLDGSNGFRINGADRAVSNAGDFNGDGFDDVIVGGGYVVFGKSSNFEATLDLSILDGSNGFHLIDLENNSLSISSVSSAGDVNGDGFDDVIIGTPRSDPNGSYSGSSYVVFGKASGISATFDLSGLDGNNGFRLVGKAPYDQVGGSVSGAGDVNGDGFDDVIVNAADFCYVVFGKASGFDAVINLSSLDGNSGFRLEIMGRASASSVSSAGDVNGDGFDDLIVGDPSAVNNYGLYGSSYVVFGKSDFTGDVIRGTPGDDTLTGTSSTERFEAGDGNDRMIGRGGADVFHGDAGDDNIVVPDLDFQQVDGGTGDDTLVLEGGGISLNLADFHDTIDGIETIDLTGSGDNTLTLTLPDLLSLSDTTDTFTVNGDAGDRVGLRNNGWKDGGIEGDYHVFSKNGTLLRVNRAVFTIEEDVINLADLDGTNGFRFDGVTEEDFSGISVSNAGDVNDDGFDDVIVGAHGADSSYVIFGKTSGFAAAMDLSSLDGSNGFRLDGGGWSVSNAGDVNGDGFDDLIVGAHGSSYVVFGRATSFAATMDLSSLDGNNGFRLNSADSDRSVSGAGDVNGDGFNDLLVGTPGALKGSGSSYVVFGKASGFAATMDLSSLDGSNGFRLNGVTEEDHSGYSVSGAGDVNGDGFDDLIVGAPYTNPSGIGSGSAYVVFGKAADFAATMDLSSLNGSNGFRLDSVAVDLSGFSVSDAGDVNGDGFDDLLVGAPGALNGSGSSYLVFGKATGFNAVLDLSTLNSNSGFRVNGVAAHDVMGESVSAAGDVNGDGFDDIVVGAHRADPNGLGDAGSSYVVFGRSSLTDDGVIRGTPGDNTLTGTSAAERFDAGDGNDRMIGGGGADEFLGEAGDDYIRISDLDFESVNGGIGNDMLALGGSDLNLNLTDMSGKISGIETIRLFGSGDNTLTLTAADVLNLSDTSNTLKVNGNAGDRIVGLSHGWGDGGIHGDFHTYFNDAAVLLVGVNVATDFAS